MRGRCLASISIPFIDCILLASTFLRLYTERRNRTVRNGYQLAVDAIKVAGSVDVNGKKIPIELTVLDDASDPTKTVLEPGPFDNTLMCDNHPLLP